MIFNNEHALFELSVKILFLKLSALKDVVAWNTNTLATWCGELTHLKKPWCWERLRAGGEGDDRGWDGWMASTTKWTWVWVDPRSRWWTGRPGVPPFMESQRVGHDWATALNHSSSVHFSSRQRSKQHIRFHWFLHSQSLCPINSNLQILC